MCYLSETNVRWAYLLHKPQLGSVEQIQVQIQIQERLASHPSKQTSSDTICQLWHCEYVYYIALCTSLLYCLVYVLIDTAIDIYLSSCLLYIFYCFMCEFFALSKYYIMLYPYFLHFLACAFIRLPCVCIYYLVMCICVLDKILYIFIASSYTLFLFQFYILFTSWFF